MARETIQEKAFRYLKEGRITIERVDTHGGVVVARCRGTEGEYMLGFDVIHQEWRCQCEERKGNCSHLVALKSVVLRP